MITEPVRDPALSLALIRSLLQRSGPDRTEVVRLTDEEVALLAGPDADELAPLPWLSTVPPEHRETALAVAARNLVVRGMALASPPQDGTGDVSVAVPEDVHAVLAARRAASTVVIAGRRAAGAPSTHILYVQGDDGVVEEHVTSGGLHMFTTGTLEAAIAALVAFVDPDGAAAHDGTAVEIELADVAMGSVEAGPLGESRYVTVVSVVSLSPGAEPAERRLSVYALPERVEVSEPRSDRPALAVCPVGPRSLHAALEKVIRGEGAR
ncbi:MAG: hypothetical protein JWN54_1324 [Mycobacterium sp.]|nr:hypothetical protein [Mycobacterium sp.]